MSSLANVRRERLQGEYKRLLELQADSNMIVLYPLSTGDAPDHYRIVMRCRGIRAVRNNVPEYANEHSIEIKLPAGFPSHGPDIYATSLIYHPNIMHNERGLVCINSWTPIRRLDEVVEQIYNMTRYLPEVTNPDSPYNSEAAIWYKRNLSIAPSLFPTDRQQIRGGSIIEIVESNGTSRGIGMGSNRPGGPHTSSNIEIVFIDNQPPSSVDPRQTDDMGIVIY